MTTPVLIVWEFPLLAWATKGTKYFWELVELLGSYIVAQCVEKMRLCVCNRLGGNFGFYSKYMILQYRVHVIRAV